ncbi:hypothetical protein H2248_005914 [Termitomyces sp. 'cryptogamus']|nr:hypothetical protein H2248_005914 [Termitomyces sp. 'cryptogamus']
MLRCKELSKLPKAASGKYVNFRRQTPGRTTNHFLPGNKVPPDCLDPSHPAMSIPKTLFPNIRDDSLGIKAVPFATLTKPEQVWTTPSSPPIDTWTERVKRLISTNANLGEGEEPLEVAPILLHSTKENAIPMSFINATSKKRTSNKKVIRVKIASRLKIAINLIVTRGADVAEVNGKLKLVMNEEEAVKMSDKWLSPGWTYIFFPTLEIYRMPYHDMIPLLRKSLRQIYDLSQEFEKKWVSNVTRPKEAPKFHYTPNHAKAFYQHTGKTTPGKPFQNRNTRQMGYRPYSTRSNPTTQSRSAKDNLDAKPHKGKKKKSHNKSQSSECLCPRSRRSNRFDKVPTLVPELEESISVQMSEFSPTAERGVTSATLEAKPHKDRFDKAPTLVPELEESMLAQMNEYRPTAERGATSAIFDVGAHKDKKKSYNKSRSSEHLSPRSRRSNKFDAAPTLVPELEERILAQMSEFDPTAEPGATSTILDVKPHKGGKKKSHNKYQSSERLSVRSRRSNKFDEAPTLVPELEESILAQMSEFDPTSEPGATSTVRLDDVAYENTFPTSILGNDIPKIIPAIREDDPTIIMLKELRDEATQWLGRSSKLYTSKRRQGFIRRRIIAQQGKPEATLDLEFIGFDSRPNPSYDPFTGVQASSRPQEDPISTHKTLLDLLNTRSARTSPRHPEYPRYDPLPPHDFDPFAPLISLEEKQHASTFRTKSPDKSLSDFSDALDFDPSAPVSPASAPKLEVELTAPNNLPAKTRSVENLVQEFNPFCTEDLDGGIIATPTPATPISPLTSGPRPRPSTSSRISRLKRAETQARAF